MSSIVRCQLAGDGDGVDPNEAAEPMLDGMLT
jgi:hypothetical protein